MDLGEFAIQLREEILAAREVDGSEDFAEGAFVSRVLGLLAEAGEIEDAEAVRHKAHGIKLNGYSLDVETETLDLFIALYTGEVPPPTIDKAHVGAAFKQLHGFLTKAKGDLYTKLEEAGPAFDAAYAIHRAFKDGVAVSKVRLFLITDGLVKTKGLDSMLRKTEPAGGPDLSLHIWDLERLFRWYTSGHAREEIDVDVKELLGGPLPCLRMPTSPSADYETLLAFVPGTLLVEIYGRYGARLLERNVRSFLQAKGAVNKGIRTTILEEPERFLAYNNGLTATASAIEVVQAEKGGLGIARIRDFQIVNGGQTTASLFHAARKDKADVGDVLVQLKLNRIKDAGRLEEIVARISQYANSQNKVNVADFSANDPFHRNLEEYSRTVWAPAAEGSQRQTHWFYERARGQYADDRARAGTPARRKEFELLNPRGQMFTKTDLAKFENTWMQRPHWVSKGAQKNFTAFTLELSKRGSFEIDERYFEWIVAKAILFKTAEKLVQAENYGGYRANIVTYALALLSHATAQRIDLASIWKGQKVPDPLQALIRRLSADVQRVIVNPPGGRNVTEWCKAEACWQAVKDIRVTIPARIALRNVGKALAAATQQDISAPDASEAALVKDAAAIEADTWFGLAKWAAETKSLAPWQRKLAFSMGRIAAQGRPPSVKQARQGLIALNAGRELGFTAD